MKKQTGAIMLIASTCIGSGMIALPMILAKVGIIPSIILMILVWLVIYHTSLVNIELVLQSGEELTLGALSKRFSGRISEFIGSISFNLLSYTLLAVYITAGSSVLQKMLESSSGVSYEYLYIVNIYGLVAIALLMLPLKIIDYLNRFLFIGLLAVVGVIILAMLTKINWSNIPLFSKDFLNLSSWKIIIPIVFTAFGFQVIFHTLAKFCSFDSVMLKRAFLWGSLIPAIVYILWSVALISSIYQNAPEFYNQMETGTVTVGSLIKILSDIAKWPLVQVIIWWISILAIVTSTLGVGIGLEGSLVKMIKIDNVFIKKILSVCLTIFPAYLLAVKIPDGFTKLLGFAGMILVVIAVILPIYLLVKAKFPKLHYKILESKTLMLLSLASGGIIMLCEIGKYFK